MTKLVTYIHLALSLLFVQASYAQIEDPVDWTYTVEELSNNEFNLVFKATVEHPWHLYGVYIEEGGPIPTSFLFKENKSIELLGKITEPKGIETYDEMFEMDIKYFEHEAIFKQKVKLLTGGTEVSGELEFMVCDDARCLPPDFHEFSFELKASAASPKTTAVKAEIQEAENTIDLSNGAEEIASETTEEPAEEEKENTIEEPVKWSAKLYKIEGEADLYQVRYTASVEEGWHLYSMNLPSQDGPLPTELSLLNEEGVEVIGKPIEGGTLINEFDNNFQMDLSFFEHTADMAINFKRTSEIDSVQANIYFMCCNDVRCLTPEDIPFTLAFSEAEEISKDDSELNLTASTHGDEHSESSESGEGDKEESKGLWTIFIISFFSGFAALLTPCVFPMIPMTVSFFTKQSKTKAEGIRKAITYGLSIIVIYVILGAVVTAIFGAESLSLLATDPWFNLFFFFLLVVFAISFLGAFEITMPSAWINKADSQADKGGLIGIFFMALVLALVSFSCTGPIVGTLIVEAASKGGVAPVIGMFGFSLAIALPFSLFAAFPGWMNSLPKSGGWLNSVKVVLGFLELALAFKFLSNADMVLDLHLLEREMFLSIWIVIFGLLTLYLLGKLRLPHDSPMEKVVVGRLILAIVFGVFTVYMIPGMWGAPVKIIAAFPPPLEYSESPMGVGFTGGGNGSSAPTGEHALDMHRGPQGIMVFHEYDKALAHAKKVNKPLMIDFTGKACVNCRKMEQDVWSNPAIKKVLSEEVVMVSLYVDLRTALPKEEQKEVSYPNGRKKKLRTIGDKWAYKQIIDYGSNSQPLYILQDTNGKDITPTANYQDHGSIPVFKEWLDEGIDAFNK